MQGLRGGSNLQCTVVGRLQAKGPGRLPNVVLTLRLVNGGPYPVSSSWAAVMECRPCHGGGVCTIALHDCMGLGRASALQKSDRLDSYTAYVCELGLQHCRVWRVCGLDSSLWLLQHYSGLTKGAVSNFTEE